MAFSSCSPPCTGSSTANTTSRNGVGTAEVFGLRYGGGAGPNDYLIQPARFHNDLLLDIDAWADNLSAYATSYRGTALSWIGHIGTFANDRCTWHRFYKAWDINHIRFANGTYLDMVRPEEGFAAPGNPGRRKRRLFWGIDASLKRYFGVAIDGVADPVDHYNHIHVDESCGLVTPPYVPSGIYSSDTKFIQHLCNDFNSATLALDGLWGTSTQTAWNSLLLRLGMTCINPLTSAASWKTFLGYITRHGLANRAAGYWTYICECT